MGENGITAHPAEHMCLNCIVLVSNNTYFVQFFFLQFHSLETEILFQKFRKKMWRHRHLLSDFFQKLIDINLIELILHIKFHEILSISFLAELVNKILVSHTQTDKRFLVGLSYSYRIPNRFPPPPHVYTPIFQSPCAIK